MNKKSYQQPHTSFIVVQPISVICTNSGYIDPKVVYGGTSPGGFGGE